MKVYSPDMHKFYQSAFNDIANWKLDGFLEKYRFLDLNLAVSYTNPHNQNSIQEDSIVNALINSITISIVDKTYREQLIAILNQLMEDKELNLTNRDHNNKTPLNNFLSVLESSKFIFRDNNNIPYFAVISQYFDLYCNMLNYTKAQNIDEALLTHPDYRIVKDATPSNNVWSYFRRVPEPNKRELTQVEVFEDFLHNYKIEGDFFLNHAHSLLSEELQEKAKGQIYNLEKLDSGLYKVNCLLSNEELKEFERIRTEALEHKRRPSLAPLQTNLRRSSVPAVPLVEISPERLSTRRASSPYIESIQPNLDEISSDSDSDQDTPEVAKGVKFAIDIEENDDLEINLSYSDTSDVEIATNQEEDEMTTPNEPKPVEKKTEPQPQPVQKSWGDLAKEKYENVKQKVLDNLPIIKKYATIAAIVIVSAIGAYFLAPVVHKLAKNYAPSLTQKTENFAKACSNKASNLVTKAKFWQNKVAANKASGFINSK